MRSWPRTLPQLRWLRQLPDDSAPWALRELASRLANGVVSDAGNIEIWDFPTIPYRSVSLPSAPARCRRSPRSLPPAVPAAAGATDDGSALFIAPAFATGALARLPLGPMRCFASAPQAVFSVVDIDERHAGIADFNGTVIGSASGPSLTLSGPLAVVNTVLAHLTDTLQSGTDVIHIVAADSSGNTAVRDVGVQISPSAASSGSGPKGGGPPATPAAAAAGILVVGGVQGSRVVPGNLNIGAGGITRCSRRWRRAPTARQPYARHARGLSGGAAYVTDLWRRRGRSIAVRSGTAPSRPQAAARSEQRHDRSGGGSNAGAARLR